MVEENVEHVVIAALRAEGRQRLWPPLAAGQPESWATGLPQLTVGHTFGLGVWARTNYAGAHCCLALLPVAGGGRGAACH